MKHKCIKGSTLLEVLIATFIVSVAMVAILTLQGILIRHHANSKAIAQASTIAQSHIENLRNYTNILKSKDEYEEFFASKDYTSTDTIVETNSHVVFGLNEAFQYDEDIVDVTIRVRWDDVTGETQSLFMKTEMTWMNPRSVGDVAMNLTEPLVSAPTGAAIIIGETVPAGTGQTHSIDDGTRYWNDAGDLKLVVGTNAVLMLKDACQNNNCTGFVTIGGKVYMDQHSQRQPSDVFVKSSNAAYCHIWYHDGNSPQTVTSNTTKNILANNGHKTTSNQYTWFNYTCYLGAGWYGNIGIVQTANGINDRVCIGESYNVEESIRRAYRGIKYTKNENGDPLTINGNIIYGEIGIRDQVSYPVADDFDENDVYTETNGDKHHFVLTNNNKDCVEDGILTKRDAVNNALFVNNRTSFVCLNQSDMYDNTFNNELFGIATVNDVPDCPYNPLEQ